MTDALVIKIARPLTRVNWAASQCTGSRGGTRPYNAAVATPVHAVEHYENFPVASWLVPARLRPPIVAIYRFARHADDIADEGDAPPAASARRTGRPACATGPRRGRARAERSGRGPARAARARARARLEPLSRAAAAPSSRTSPSTATPTCAALLDYCRTLGQSGRATGARAIRRARSGQPRAVGSHLHRAAADQLRAGRRDRLAPGTAVPAAGRAGAPRRRARPTSRPPRATRSPGPGCAPASRNRRGPPRRCSPRGRRWRGASRAGSAWELRAIVAGATRMLRQLERGGHDPFRAPSAPHAAAMRRPLLMHVARQAVAR